MDEFNSIIRWLVKRGTEKIMEILCRRVRLRFRKKRKDDGIFSAVEAREGGKYWAMLRSTATLLLSRRFLPARSLGPYQCAVPNINLLVRRLAVPSIPGPGRAFIFYGFGDTRAREPLRFLVVSDQRISLRRGENLSGKCEEGIMFEARIINS